MPPTHNKYAITQCEFRLFVVLWNQAQGRKTPPVHLRMADWLERAYLDGDTRLLLMAFRSCGKSTLVGLFAAWLLYRWPDLRILVLAADQILAGKMVRNVKRIIERHPLTTRMKPDRADQWASERFTVRRMIEQRDPSMLARGVGSNITGSRADMIICDDVEVPNTCDSAEKRAALRERLEEINYVLVPGGTQLFIGTPHTYFTIYADAPRKEAGEVQVFLHGFKRLKIPVLGADGNSAWPERFSPAAIEQMKRSTGPNKFASQMMLEPVNIAEGRLNPELLRIHDMKLLYARELGTLFIGDRKMVSASAWWDPAFGSAKGDASVLAVVYADAHGNLYLQHIDYISCPPGGETDEATAQCRIVARLARELYLPFITVEINGIGRFLPGILRNELATAKAPCAVVEVSSTRPKDLRILEAFDAVLAARRLYVHESVMQTPFAVEMQEWKPGRAGGHDDGLDAVAGALSQQPMRLKRLYGGGGHSWMRGADTQKAKTDFEV